MKYLNLLPSLLLAILLTGCEKTNKVRENIKEKIVRESYRPTFHFTPQEKWMNDPNGLVYDKGYYHLFYQYYPDSTVWGPMHWGHAKSKDLLKWEHLPIALYPDSLGYIFSGSAVIDKTNTAGFGEGAMVAIFTYHDPVGEKEGSILFQTQGIAYSLDDGITWTKYDGNPVISNPGIRDFRDPKVFWNVDRETWQMALVAKDHVQFYESPNLKDWEKLSDFRFEDTEELGVWECPDLFEMTVEETGDNKWVLIVSHGAGAPNGGSGTRYFVGDYDGTTFSTNQKSSQWIDFGTDNYAGVTYNNTPDGRRIFIGWMSNWAYAITTPTIKWRSAMILPRELELVGSDGQYALKTPLVKEFEDILKTVNSEDLGGNPPLSFNYPELQQSKISFEITTLKSFKIILSNDSDEEYFINYDHENAKFLIDRSNSGLVNFSPKFTNPSPQIMPVGELKEIQLDMVLDASSIEIVLNNGSYVVTNQIFPSEPYTNFEIQGVDKNEIANFRLHKVLKAVSTN
ncbi:MAG: glycoside hydrolase family 32 protein [Flavobacteriaceae bacterium]|nr:glycoside hydrolase family 32 protein [Bacteroidia bacterium]MBT8269132.1 glycoside hydrolase family 32 protein [Bacteroidia bacterium]NNF73666.1 glycoside hydrolase family 32 protein [Flavobacteriaceae bacterium]NNK69123.1 glycoside hydrolase family 32 protein [Flavobacteriaceae bacterium]